MLREQILNTLTTKKEMVIIRHDGGRCQIQAYFQKIQFLDVHFPLFTNKSHSCPLYWFHDPKCHFPSLMTGGGFLSRLSTKDFSS